MAFSSKVGAFSLNTSTGNQAVTGVGFQPKIVFFFVTENTGNGVIAHNSVCIGAGISSSAQGCCHSNDEDAQTGSDCTRFISQVNLLRLMQPGSNGTIYLGVDLVTLDADGFTINITNAPSAAYRVGYLALGGTDLTNVKVGGWNPSGSTGNQSVTGVGFQPSAVILLQNGAAFSTSTNNGEISVGFAVSSSQRAWIGASSDNGVNPCNTWSRQQIDSCIGEVYYSDGTINSLADFVSFGADGFTVNWSIAGTAADGFLYIALAGGNYAVGSLTTQTGTGNFSTSGLGFQPVAGLFASFCNPATGASVSGTKNSFGVVGAAGGRFVCGTMSEDNQSPTDTDSFQSNALMYQAYDYNQTVEGAIDFVSWDSDGFTLNQTDGDPAGNQLFYLAMGLPAAAGISAKQILVGNQSIVRSVAW